MGGMTAVRQARDVLARALDELHAADDAASDDARSAHKKAAHAWALAASDVLLDTEPAPCAWTPVLIQGGAA